MALSGDVLLRRRRTVKVKRGLRPDTQPLQQLSIVFHVRIARGEQFFPIENRIGARHETQRLGFFAHARTVLPTTPNAARLIFNDRLDAALALSFMAVVVLVIAASAREWWLVLSKRKAAAVNEAAFVESAYALGD